MSMKAVTALAALALASTLGSTPVAAPGNPPDIIYGYCTDGSRACRAASRARCDEDAIVIAGVHPAGQWP